MPVPRLLRDQVVQQLDIQAAHVVPFLVLGGGEVLSVTFQHSNELPRSIGRDGVLVNDTDADLPNDIVTVNTTPVASPQHGSLTLHSDGTFRYTHDGSENHTDSFRYQVEDAGGHTDTATVTILVAPVNDQSPVLQPIGDQSVDEQGTLSLTAAATDADLPSQTPSYSLDEVSLAAGMSITPEGVFSWTPTEDQGGSSHNATITVTDDGSNPDHLTDSQTIAITVSEVNVAPVLEAIGPKAVDEQSLLSFTAGNVILNLVPAPLVALGTGMPIAAALSVIGVLAILVSRPIVGRCYRSACSRPIHLRPQQGA